MPLWTPALLDPPPSLWLDASDAATITLEGSTISAWMDKSGSGNNAVQATVLARPVVAAASQNGLDVIRFDGVDDLLVVSMPVDIESAETYVVAKTRGAGPSAYTYNGTGQYPTDRWCIGGEFFGIAHLKTYVGVATDFAVRSLRASGSSKRAYSDGRRHMNFSSSESAIHASLPIGGGTDNGPVFGQVDIAEVLHFDAPTPSGQREIIEGYLAHKWGIADNLYSRDYEHYAPANGLVAGVIRDKDGVPCSRLYHFFHQSGPPSGIIAHGRSDAVTGEYSHTFKTLQEVTRLVFSEDDDPLLNNIVDRIIPE